MVSGWMWLADSQFSHNDLNYWLTANLKTLFQLHGLHSAEGIKFYMKAMVKVLQTGNHALQDGNVPVFAWRD
jgi:hypothetical protein